MTLQEILDSREVKVFSGFSKESLVNMLWWRAVAAAPDFETPRKSYEFIVRYPTGIGKSGYTEYMKWDDIDGKPITAKVTIPWDRYLDALVSGKLGWQYEVNKQTGERKYKTPSSPIELVCFDLEAIADLPCVYVLGGTALGPVDWLGPTVCGEVFDGDCVWPVEPLDAGDMDVWEGLFYLHTNRRIPGRPYPQNVLIWGGIDTGDINDMGTKEKFLKGSGTDVQMAGVATYNDLYGSEPDNGYIRLSIPYVQFHYDNDENIQDINGQDPEEFAWELFQPGDANWWSPNFGETVVLTGVVTDLSGNRYLMTLHPLE